MAQEVFDELKLRLSLDGIDNIERALRLMGKSSKFVIDNNAQLIKTYGSIGNAVNVLEGKVKRAGEEFKTQFGTVKSNLKQVFDLAMKGMGSLTFGSAVKGAAEYGQALSVVSIQVSRLGIGFDNVSKSIDRMAKKTSILRTETLQMFSQYQMETLFPSMEGFELILGRIGDVVGADEKAVNGMMSSIINLTKEYPSFGAAVQNVNDGNSESIVKQITIMASMGKISRQMQLDLLAYVNGQSLMSDADRADVKAKQDAKKVLGEIKVIWESIALSVGNEILPHITKFANYLKENSGWVEKIKNTLDGWNLSFSKILTGIVSFQALGTILPQVGIGLGKELAKAMYKGISGGISNLPSLFSFLGGGGLMQAGRYLLTAATTFGPAIAAAFGIFKLIGELNNSKKGQDLAQKAGYGDDLNNEKFLGSKFLGKTIVGSGIWSRSKDQEKFNAQLQEKIDKNKISRQQEINKTKEDEKKTQTDITRKAAQQVIEAVKLANEMTAIEESMESISSFYQAQISLTGSLAKKMSLTGNVDKGALLASFSASAETLSFQIEQKKKLLSFWQSMSAQEAESGIKSGDITGITEEQKKQVDNGKIDIVQKTKIAQYQAEVLDFENQRVQASSAVAGVYDDQLGYLSAMTSQASTAVQMANNYAIGVKASASLIMMEYDTQERMIKVLKEKLSIDRNLYEMSKKSGQEDFALKTRVAETENKILQAQQSQASAVKSMRDGWASALSAMNTGAGAFTEIIMSSEENTAQVTKLAGHMRSDKSGASARRDAFGNIVENIGYGGSTRMTAQGQLGVRGGGRFGDTAYTTVFDEMMGNRGRLAESGLRGMTVQASERMAAQGEISRSGGGSALAASSSSINRGAATGDLVTPSYGGQASAGVNVSLDNIKISFENVEGLKELPYKIADIVNSKINDVFKEMGNQFGRAGSPIR